MSCHELAGALVMFVGIFVPGVMVGSIFASVVWLRRSQRQSQRRGE